MFYKFRWLKQCSPNMWDMSDTELEMSRMGWFYVRQFVWNNVRPFTHCWYLVSEGGRKMSQIDQFYIGRNVLWLPKAFGECWTCSMVKINVSHQARLLCRQHLTSCVGHLWEMFTSWSWNTLLRQSHVFVIIRDAVNISIKQCLHVIPSCNMVIIGYVVFKKSDTVGSKVMNVLTSI